MESILGKLLQYLTANGLFNNTMVYCNGQFSVSVNAEAQSLEVHLTKFTPGKGDTPIIAYAFLGNGGQHIFSDYPVTEDKIFGQLAEFMLDVFLNKDLAKCTFPLLSDDQFTTLVKGVLQGKPLRLDQIEVADQPVKWDEIVDLPKVFGSEQKGGFSKWYQPQEDEPSPLGPKLGNPWLEWHRQGNKSYLELQGVSYTGGDVIFLEEVVKSLMYEDPREKVGKEPPLLTSRDELSLAWVIWERWSMKTTKGCPDTPGWGNAHQHGINRRWQLLTSQGKTP